MPWSHLADRDGYLRATEVDTQNKSQIADLLPHHLESTTMNELPKLTRQHCEKDEASFYLPSEMKENFFEDKNTYPGTKNDI